MVFILFFASCEMNKLTKSDFQEVDFSQEQKIHVVTNENIYNIVVTFSENKDFSLRFSDEAPDVYKQLSVSVNGGICTVSDGEITYEKPIEEFNNTFLPKIVYSFFEETDFSAVEYTYNETEKTRFFECFCCGKTLVFTAQLSLDSEAQNFVIEIK